MRLTYRLGLLALALVFAAAPQVSRAQSITCSPGTVFTTFPGGGYGCIPLPPGAPEIGMSSSAGGLAVLLCGALMLRGRKRTIRGAAVAA